MSLILEALRKSEAERRLGSAPDVLAAMPVLRAPAQRSRGPLMIAIGLIAALAALAWWWYPVAIPSVPNVPQQTARSGAYPGTTKSSARARSNPSTEQQTAATLPIITLPTTAMAPANDAASARSGHGDATASTPPSKATVDSAQAAMSKITTAGPIEPVAAESTTIASGIKPAVGMHATPTPKPAVADEPALPPLSELSTDERSALPALNVSMHVYADDAAQRFMIIDGHRLGEGARVADGVTLVRIRRDGAELDVHGRRLLLPNP